MGTKVRKKSPGAETGEMGSKTQRDTTHHVSWSRFSLERYWETMPLLREVAACGMIATFLKRAFIPLWRSLLYCIAQVLSNTGSTSGMRKWIWCKKTVMALLSRASMGLLQKVTPGEGLRQVLGWLRHGTDVTGPWRDKIRIIVEAAEEWRYLSILLFRFWKEWMLAAGWAHSTEKGWDCRKSAFSCV